MELSLTWYISSVWLTGKPADTLQLTYNSLSNNSSTCNRGWTASLYVLFMKVTPKSTELFCALSIFNKGNLFSGIFSVMGIFWFNNLSLMNDFTSVSHADKISFNLLVADSGNKIDVSLRSQRESISKGCMNGIESSINVFTEMCLKPFINFVMFHVAGVMWRECCPSFLLQTLIQFLPPLIYMSPIESALIHILDSKNLIRLLDPWLSFCSKTSRENGCFDFAKLN